MTDPVEATRLVYDQVVATYDEAASAVSEHLDAHRAAFAARVTGRVADLGCGPGRDLMALTALGVDVIGVDLSSGMLELARTRGRVVRGDLRRPPLRPAGLGGVWSSAALLHVPRQDVPATLAAWHALLRPGGVLGLTTSLAAGGSDGWERVPYAPPRPTSEPLDRWYVHHDEAALLTLLRDAGFTVDSAQRNTTKREWLRVLATA